MDTAVNHDFIAQLDAAIGCQQCEQPLGDSPSDDFCSPRCQTTWSASRAEPLTNYREPSDLPQYVGNQVELYSPEVDPSGSEDWWQGAVIAAHRREARTRAAATRQPSDAITAAAFAFGAYRRRHAVGVTPDGEVVGRHPDGRIRLVDHVAQGAFDSVLANTIAELGRSAGIPPEMVVSWMSGPSIAEQALEAERERHARMVERYAERHAPLLAPFGITFECTHVDPDVLELFFGGAVEEAPRPDPRQRALELRRNRNTGPSSSARAPRAINPRRGR